MSAINNPEICHVDKPRSAEIRFPDRKPKSAVRQALRLWTSLHRLTSTLDVLCEQHPAKSHLDVDSFSRSAHAWHHWPKPANQACFHEWVQAIEAPSVKGLKVYAAKSGNIRFFGAWIERSGVFVGWMRIQPHISGIESDYAVGEVLGRPVFMGITLDLSGHDAIDRFSLALRNAAWDLGVSGG
jgi:hypothetical protein